MEPHMHAHTRECNCRKTADRGRRRRSSKRMVGSYEKPPVPCDSSTLLSPSPAEGGEMALPPLTRRPRNKRGLSRSPPVAD